MKKKRLSQREGFFNPRVLLVCVRGSVCVFVALVRFGIFSGPSGLAQVSGSISYCSNPVADTVPNVTLNLTRDTTTSTPSDGSGNYRFSPKTLQNLTPNYIKPLC